MISDSFHGMYRGCRGFTLLELLISITLVSVIIVILSMAIRTGLRAYMRGREANRQIVAVSAIQGLLRRQLMMAVRPGLGNLSKFFRFHGDEDELIFVTTHVPLGSQSGGIFLVVYRFQQGDDSLVYAQHIVTEPAEVEDELPGHVRTEDIKDLRDQGWDVSIVPGIHALSFSYLDPNSDMDVAAVDRWPSAWYRDRQLPASVGLVVELDSDNPERRRNFSSFFDIPEWSGLRQRGVTGK